MRWFKYKDNMEGETPTRWSKKFYDGIKSQVKSMSDDGFSIEDNGDDSEEDEDEDEDPDEFIPRIELFRTPPWRPPPSLTPLPSKNRHTCREPYMSEESYMSDDEPLEKKVKCTLDTISTLSEPQNDADTISTLSEPQNDALCYDALVCVFKYLNHKDLLNARAVCVSWLNAANCSTLWRIVQFKHTPFPLFLDISSRLLTNGIVHLDVSAVDWARDNDTLCNRFADALQELKVSLRKIDLCPCSGLFVEQLARELPDLQVIFANAVVDNEIDFEPIATLKNLKELSLYSCPGFSIIYNVGKLAKLEKLWYLSFTSVTRLEKLNLNKIAKIKNLEVLTLGNCSSESYFNGVNEFIDKIPSSLPKLTKLMLVNGAQVIVLSKDITKTDEP